MTNDAGTGRGGAGPNPRLVSSGRSWRWPRDPAAVVFVFVEAAAFVTFVALGRFAWFNGDEWDFLAARSAGSLHDLFRPHNVHWSTLPLLAYRFLWATVGLRSYLPYVVLVVSLHLLAAGLLRRVMVRAGVAPWIATVAASAFAMFGTGYFNIVYPFQIGFDGSLVFGLAQLLAADHKGALDRHDWIGLGCGLAGLMCSGVGVSMTVAVGVAVLIRRGWRLALFHTAPLAAIYLIWFAVIGRTGDLRHSTPSEVIRSAGHYAWATFVAIGQSGVVGGALAAVLIAAAACTLATRRSTPLRRAASPIALAAAAAAFLLITGSGRGYLTQGPAESRYLHVTAALLVPAIAVAADVFVRRWRVLLAAVVPLFLVGVPGNLHVLVEHSYDRRATPRSYRRFVLALPRLPIARELPRSTRVDPIFDPWVTIGWLLDGVRSGRIPSPGRISPHAVASLTFLVALRSTRAPMRANTCARMAPGQTLALRAADKLAVTGVVHLRYLPPAGRAPPPVNLGSLGTQRAFVVVARSMTVRVENTTVNGQLRVCRSTTPTS
jgi:hypothetical protein